MFDARSSDSSPVGAVLKLDIPGRHFYKSRSSRTDRRKKILTGVVTSPTRLSNDFLGEVLETPGLTASYSR